MCYFSLTFVLGETDRLTHTQALTYDSTSQDSPGQDSVMQIHHPV